MYIASTHTIVHVTVIAGIIAQEYLAIIDKYSCAAYTLVMVTVSNA